MRRPSRWLVALALLAGGSAIAIRLHLHLSAAAPQVLPATTTPAASLGPVPLAVSDEGLQPAQLSGQIESAAADGLAEGDSLNSNSLIHAAVPPCEPPPLGDDPWRPSARMAGYQADAADRRDSRPAQHGLAAADKPTRDPRTMIYDSHRIVDGDTLSGLAQRYLGSSQRFAEIFDANRDRLQTPDVLPIGLVLRIPTNSAK